MKKLIVIFLCLITVSCLFTSCSARMNRPEFPTQDDRGMDGGVIGEWADGFGNNDRERTDRSQNAGDYQADEDGKVRSYNSDNDFSF